MSEEKEKRKKKDEKKEGKRIKEKAEVKREEIHRAFAQRTGEETSNRINP